MFATLSLGSPRLYTKALNSKSFEFKKNVSTCRTPNDYLLLLLCRTEFFKRSFSNCAAEVWNSIPRDIRNAASLRNFKCKLYNYLLKVNV